jgi:hypothetical protein
MLRFRFSSTLESVEVDWVEILESCLFKSDGGLEGSLIPKVNEVGDPISGSGGNSGGSSIGVAISVSSDEPWMVGAAQDAAVVISE